MPTNINRVVLDGELLDDPVLLDECCRLRLLVTSLRKAPDGSWVGRPNVFDVVVPGQDAAGCAALRRGRMVAVEGSLAWEPADLTDPNSRARVEVVAGSVRPLDARASQLIPVAAPSGPPAAVPVPVTTAGVPGPSVAPDPGDDPEPAPTAS